jgi:hypothetical protein
MAMMITAIAGILFLAAVWIRPALRLPAMVRELKGHLKFEASGALLPDTKAENWQPYYEQSRAVQERLAKLARGSRHRHRARCTSASTWTGTQFDGFTSRARRPIDPRRAQNG